MAENIPRDFIELLLSKVDLVDLINSQVPLQKKSSNNYFARCPFHNENSASFSVSQQKQFYYCFGCGAHGNAIDFLIQFERLNFPEAIESLAKQTGLEIPRSSQPVKQDSSVQALYDLHTKVAAFYYEQMRKSDKAIAYLKQRGISGAIAQKFCIGYATAAWEQIAQQFGKSDADIKNLQKAGLVVHKTQGKYYDRFRDRIIFPIFDTRGRVIGLGGRIIDQGEPKYLNSPETPLFQKGYELYGLYEALQANRKLEQVIIVEGYMDVIALYQQGITNAVATLGTATTPHHLHKLLRYTTQLVFCFDGDKAGLTAAKRSLSIIFPVMNDEISINFLFLPEGEDPDSIIRKESKDAFQKRIAEAVTLSEFFFQTMIEDANLETIEGRSHFASRALATIKLLPASIYQGMLLGELSKRAGVSLADLKRGVIHHPARKLSTSSTPLIPINNPDLGENLPAPIKHALVLLLHHPHLIQSLKEPLPHFDLLGYEHLLDIVAAIQANPDITTANLFELWRGKDGQKLFAQLAFAAPNVPEAGLNEEFLGTIRQMTILGYNAQIAKLMAKQKQAGLTNSEKIELTMLIGKKKSMLP